MDATATRTKKTSNHPFPWLNAMVAEPYYLFHFLYFFSYIVARTSASRFLSPDSSLRLLRWEIQAFLAFCVLTVIKLVKEETWESFIADTLFFAKVEFRASCSLTCVRTSCFLPELSNTYSNKNISFGIVDVVHFPIAAEKFGISLGVNMGQLPTYILFENAAEITRLPAVDFEAKPSSPTITKSLLCRHFELDLHLLEFVSGK